VNPVKVVYFYTSHGSAQAGSTPDDWKLPASCGKQYSSTHGDGTFKLLEELHNKGIISDLRVFFESNRAPGKADWIPGVYCSVIPELRFAKPFIHSDTIIFARGGFKGWHDLLVSYKEKNWLMLYAANTGRERWPWWDVILEDRKRLNVIDRNERYWNFYIKPTNEEIFYPEKREIKYDFCIGASHVHDKKGQWRTIEALIEYKRLYGKCPRCIMPGAPRKGTKSNLIANNIKRHGLDVEVAGEVTKQDLCRIFNESRFFIHLGTHGQNDRGPIEAMACGTPLNIGSPAYHSPVINELAFIPNDINNFKEVAIELNRLLRHYEKVKDYPYHYYQQEHSFARAYGRMEALLKTMGQYSPGMEGKQKLKEIFDSIV